jgi:hypothetical protein
MPFALEDLDSNCPKLESYEAEFHGRSGAYLGQHVGGLHVGGVIEAAASRVLGGM